MTSFIQPGFSKRHAGVERLEAALDSAKEVGHSFDGTRGLSAMLLAAMVAALVVVADQLIDTWADGHLMAAWVALWVVAFAAVAVFADSARQLAVTTVNSLDAWSAKMAKQRADQRMWTIAQSDPRLMAELTAAIERSRSE